MRVLVLCCLLTSGIAAAQLQRVAGHDYIRPGLMWRLVLRGSQLPAGGPPLRLRVQLIADQQVLAASSLQLTNPATWQLDWPVQLIPDAPTTTASIHWTARLYQDQQLLTQANGGLLSVQQLVEHARTVQPTTTAEPPLRFWWQQAMTLLRGSRRLGDWRLAAQLCQRLERPQAALAEHRKQSERLEAFISPDDGSLQPVRLWLPEGPPRRPSVVILHRPSQVPTKGSWRPALPETAQALLLAGHAVIQPYPAADIAWQDVAIRRLPAAVAAVAAWCPTQQPLLVAEGSAADAALVLLGQTPWSWTGALLLTPRPRPPQEPSSALPATWQAWLASLPHPLSAAPQLSRCHLAVSGQTTAYADRLRAIAQADPTGLWLARPLPDKRSLLDWLGRIQAPSPAGAWEIRSPLPLDLGPLQLRQPQTWGEALLIRGELRSGELLATNLADLSLDWPLHHLNGNAWQPPSVDQPVKRLGQCLGLPGLATSAPFAVVIGSGEHAGITARNQTNARSFLRAWGRHAHGQPSIYQDDDPAIPNETNLLCFGSPRSHRILQQAWASRPPPVRWQERELLLNERRFLRDDSAIILCWPDARQPHRCLVAIDGANAARLFQEGAPLQGLPDLSIIDGQDRLTQRIFTVDWR